MNDNMIALSQKIKALESELEAEIAIASNNLKFTLHGGKVKFEQAILEAHRALRTSTWRYFIGTTLLNLLVAPVIYPLIIPFVRPGANKCSDQCLCHAWQGRYQKVSRASHGRITGGS